MRAAAPAHRDRERDRTRDETNTGVRARRDRREHAARCCRRFPRRWLESEPGPELLGSADIQALNDLGGSYQIVESMRPLPFGLRELLQVVVAAGLPMLPLLAMEVPLSNLLLKVLRALLGGA